MSLKSKSKTNLNPQNADHFEVPSMEEMRANTEKASQFDLKQAEEIWRLAAQLQAEEAQRQAETFQQNKEEEFKFPNQNFNLNEVSEIAKSAGIDPKFVAMALQNQQNLVAWETPTPPKSVARAAKYLDFAQNRVSVKKRYKLSKAETVKALQNLFKSDAYKLSLIETLPSQDENVQTLIFGVPLLNMAGVGTTEHGQSYNSFSYYMTYSDMNRLAVSIRSLSATETEVEILGDLKWGKRRNYIAGSWLNAIMGGMGGVIGFALGHKSADMGLIGAMLGGTVGTMGWLYFWRWIYAWGVKKAETLLQELLDKVEVTAKNDGWH